MRSATRVVASTFGVVVGLAGLEHGIGEVLQGSVAPSGIMFESWPDSEFLRILGGEPAMAIIPNLLVAGILTVLVSLLFIAWAVLFTPRRLGGLGLILLSVVLLLVGGGVAPPIMGLIIGAAATRIGKPLSWGARRSSDHPPFLARLWVPALIAGVVGYLAVLPGIPIVDHFLGLESPMVVVDLALFSFAALLAAVLAALAWDSYHAALAKGQGAGIG